MSIGMPADGFAEWESNDAKGWIDPRRQAYWSLVDSWVNILALQYRDLERPILRQIVELRHKIDGATGAEAEAALVSMAREGLL